MNLWIEVSNIIINSIKKILYYNTYDTDFLVITFHERSLKWVAFWITCLFCVPTPFSNISIHDVILLTPAPLTPIHLHLFSFKFSTYFSLFSFSFSFFFLKIFFYFIFLQFCYASLNLGFFLYKKNNHFNSYINGLLLIFFFKEK